MKTTIKNLHKEIQNLKGWESFEDADLFNFTGLWESVNKDEIVNIVIINDCISVENSIGHEIARYE